MNESPKNIVLEAIDHIFDGNYKPLQVFLIITN